MLLPRWIRRWIDPVEGVIDYTYETPVISWANLFEVINDPRVKVAIPIDPRIQSGTYLVVPPSLITPILRRIKKKIDAGKHPGLRFTHNATKTVLITAKPDPLPDHLYQWQSETNK